METKTDVFGNPIETPINFGGAVDVFGNSVDDVAAQTHKDVFGNDLDDLTPSASPSPEASLSASAEPSGVLPFKDATGAGDIAFKETLMAKAREKVAKESPLERGAKTAAASVIPTLAGIGVGAGTGAGLGAMGLNPITVGIGGIAGGIVGGIGSEMVQAEAMKKVMGEEGYAQYQAEQQARREASPVATFVGETAPQLLVLKPSVKNVVASWEGVKALTKGVLDSGTPQGKALVEQMANVGLGAGVAGAQEAFFQYQAGDLSAGRLVAQIVAGALINEPNKFGIAMKLNPSTGEVEPVPVAEQPPQSPTTPQTAEVIPTPTPEVASAPGGVQPIAKPIAPEQPISQPLPAETINEQVRPDASQVLPREGVAPIKPVARPATLTAEEQAGIGKAADFMAGVDADKAALEPPVRQKYVEPKEPVAEMSVKALREELKANGVETTTRQKVVELREMANRTRTEKLAKEKQLQRMEAPPKPIKVESAEARMNRQRGVVDRVGGTSEAAGIARADAMEQKIRDHIDSGKYIEPGTMVTDKRGNVLEVISVRRYGSDKDLGSPDLTYELRNPDSPADQIVRRTSELSTGEETSDVPFRTEQAIKEAPSGDGKEATAIINRMLGKSAKVEIVDRIFEKGAERLGKYQKGLVTIARGGDMERTAYHEAMHGAEDMLMTQAERDGLSRIMPDREKRADAFMEYAKKNGKGFSGAVRAYFDRLMFRIKKLFGVENGIDELKAVYARLMQGVYAKRKAVAPSADVSYRTPTGDPTTDAGLAKMDAGRAALEDSLAAKNTWWRRAKDFAGRNLVANTSPIRGREQDVAKAMGAPIVDLVDKSYMSRQRQQGALGYAGVRMDGYRSELKKAGFKSDADIRDLGDYLTAKRTVEVYDGNAQRVADGLDPVKSPLTRAEAEAIARHYEAKDPKFVKASDETRKVFQESLKHLQEAGLITAAQVRDMTSKGQHYFPRAFMDKIDPEVGAESSKMGAVSVRASGLKFLKSCSEGHLISDPLLNVAQNIANAEVVSFRNLSNQALDDLVKQIPDAVKKNTDFDMKPAVWDATANGGKGGFTDPLDVKYERIEFMRDGKKQGIDVRKDLAAALKMVDPAVASDTAKLMRLFSGTSLVKFMATSGNPEFAIGNIFRDFGLQYLAGGEYSPIAPIAMYQQIRNASKALTDRKLYAILRSGYERYGAASGWLSSRDFMPTRNDLKSQSYKHTRGVMTAILDAMGYVGNKSEELGRLSLVNQAFRNMGVDPRTATPDQWLKATSKAKEIINFSDGGRLVKAVDNVIPFLNPAFQGGRSIFRGFKERPVETSFKAMQIVAASTLLYQWNRRQDEKSVDSISDGDLSSKMNFVLNSEKKDKEGNSRYGYIGIPVDQAWRPFVILGKMIADKMDGEEVNADLLKKSIGANYVPVDFANLPPVLSAILTYTQNHDFWKGDKIWKGREVEPEAERKVTTPSLAKTAGDVTGLSPERLAASWRKLAPQHPLTYAASTLADMYDTDAGAKAKEDNALSFSQWPGVRRILRFTSPRELSESDISKAKKLKVQYKDKAPRKVMTEVQEKEVARNTFRQKNDLKFDELAVKVKSGDATKADIYREAWKLAKEDPKERVRILRYLKQKYPKMYIVAPSAED